MKRIFGLDIGGTGIKGGIVNVKKGVMETERLKIATPQPATPEAVADVVKQLVEKFDWHGPIGCGFPAIIKKNVCHTATNIDKSWIGVDVAKLISDKTGMSTQVINDADAAALCELHFGAAKGKSGLVMLTTVGTGIGCGMLYNGVLIPNCELGVTYLENGIMLEKYSSNSARKRDNLDWNEYGARLNVALQHIDRLVSPDLFILGGGMSKKFKFFKAQLNPEIKIRTAEFHNDAGCIGAALAYTA